MDIEKVFKIAIQLWPIYLIALIIFIVLISFAVVNFIKAHQAYREGDQKEKRGNGFILSGFACGVLVLCVIFACVFNSCPGCGNIFSNNQKYCNDCGVQLSYTCSCGNTNPVYTVYCPHCGTEVKGCKNG